MVNPAPHTKFLTVPAHWFLTLDDARTKMEEWRRYYNEDRPHGAIGNKCPIALQLPDGAASPSS